MTTGNYSSSKKRLFMQCFAATGLCADLTAAIFFSFCIYFFYVLRSSSVDNINITIAQFSRFPEFRDEYVCSHNHEKYWIYFDVLTDYLILSIN